MLEEILHRFATSSWDFRSIACPEDPLADRWPEWVPYYRMKAAIAAALQPSSICEIGVRYGYSAAAFLHGAPAARYLGIDLDAASSDQTPGTFAWARRILPDGQSTFTVGDTQRMSRLPGGVYDLVHVYGQQDGDGTWHDLTLAAAQARWILLDGYFWSRVNMLAASEWLLRNRDVVAWSGMIPDYGGELLVKLRPTALADAASEERDSAAVAHCYTAPYYLEDCGGYDSFRRHGGRRLDDPRLRALAALADVGPGGRVLDVGCGRGELTYHFAQRGCHVTAVDYAAEAIALARACFAADDPALARVRFVQGDVNTVALDGPYDVVVAADVIEHLADHELERLYARLAGVLAPGGRVVVHTFPNAWHYRYDYPRARRRAAAAGGWLPPDPRTRFERLMHLNEQSPQMLRRALARHFPSVALWFGDPTDPAGTLARRATIDGMRTATDLFAVASAAPVERGELRGRLRMEPLPRAAAPGLHLALVACPDAVTPPHPITLRLRVENRTGAVLTSFPPAQIHLSYHWLAPSGAMAVFEGRRTPILPPLASGQSAEYAVDVAGPPAPGEWLLQITAVQEGHYWFEHAAGFVPVTRRMRTS